MKPRQSGFSLIEMLLAVTLMGVIGGLSYPVVVGLIDEGQMQAAKSVAQSVNAAKQSFRMKRFKAHQEYSQSSSDTERYALIKDYLPVQNGTLKDLLPKGYQISMAESLNDRVTLRGPKGAIQY